MTTYTERSISTEAYTDRGAITAPAMRERGTITAAFYTTDTSVSTRDDTAPVISNIHANLLYADNAEIDWDTDEMATCQVKWTTDSSLAYESWTSGTIHEHLVTNPYRENDVLFQGEIRRPIWERGYISNTLFQNAWG
jgi:hypothetical protein